MHFYLNRTLISEGSLFMTQQEIVQMERRRSQAMHDHRITLLRMEVTLPIHMVLLHHTITLGHMLGIHTRILRHHLLQEVCHIHITECSMRHLHRCLQRPIESFGVNGTIRTE